MVAIEKANAGTFCWVELNTTDPAAAKRFYGELFGWSLADMPTPNGTYTMASIGSNNVAGIMVLPEEAKKMGAPPHFLSYVAVDDAKATAEKVKSLGGKVLRGPMSAGPGQMAVIQDPTGAVFAIFQTLQSMGTFLYMENGASCWNELMTNDVDRAGKFYAALFGWKPDPMNVPGGSPYVVFKQGENGVGGMMPTGTASPGHPSVWGVYFAVENADATVRKVEQLGGKVSVPAQDIPTIGRFAVFTDPQGAAFAILQPAERKG
jgi:predicted enzyme related to lactoylglutathione lyase